MGDSDPAFVWESAARRASAEWVRLFAVAFAIAAVVAPIVAVVSIPEPTPAPVVETEHIQETRARLAELSTGPTGTEVAMAGWCLQQGTSRCQWRDLRMSRKEAEAVLDRLERDAEVPKLLAELEAAEAALAEVRADTIEPQVYALIVTQRVLVSVLAVSGFGGLAAVLFLLSLRSLPIRIRQHEIVLGSTRIPSSDVVGCTVERNRILVQLLGGHRHETAALDVEAEILEEIAEQIRAVALSPDDRRAEARARVEFEARKAALDAQLRR